LTGGTRTTTAEPLGADERVGVVAGAPVYASGVEARLARFQRGPRARHLPPGGSASQDARRWVAREVILEEVVAHELAARGLCGTTDAAVARLVGIVTEGVTVSEHDIRAYYERNADLYRRPEMRLARQIVVADEPAAIDIVRRLACGDEMVALAHSFSIDRGSAVHGGDLGWITRLQFAGPLGEQIFDARVGATVGPIRTEHGWHVVRVESATPSSVAGYNEVRGAIEAELLAAARASAFGEWLEGRWNALVQLEPAFSHPADPSTGLPSHRH
jgi:hypothetical protein